MDTVNGIFLLDKPRGLSSNAALQRVRRLLGAAKAGHVGSLDPLATGMLPICLGEATKIAGDIVAGRKCYRFTIALGTRTATGDTEGEVIERAAVPRVPAALLDEVLRRFTGEQQQVPPMYSALKRDGQPLYRLARAGIEVERAARPVLIYSLERAGRVASAGEVNESLQLQVVCSKGTYVRTLAEDLASALGTCGHVTMLRRLYVEPFAASAMLELTELEQAVSYGESPRLLAADAPLQHLPAVVLDARQSAQVQHGQSITALATVMPGRVRLYDEDHAFLGMGEADSTQRVCPRRLFVAPVSGC